MDRAPERERLLIRARWGLLANDLAMLAVAETLTIRYAAEVDGHLLLGSGLTTNAQYTRALPHLRRVIHMDSLPQRQNAPSCSACEALQQMVGVYIGLDSLSAAERVIREWTALQPGSALPWMTLAHLLEAQSRIEEARTARLRGTPFSPGQPYDHVFPAMLAIRTGDFTLADAALRVQVRNAPPPIQSVALWFLVISLRYQGRLQEALEVARQVSAREPDDVARRVVEAQVLFEMGRHREAAALFDAIARQPRTGVVNRSPGVLARHRTWYLTHAATALAAAGDTTRVAELADSIEAYGTQSLYGRDRKLHHHVRGLLLATHAQHAAAAETFRRATEWPIALTSPFNRTNLELARTLVILGRAGEAVQTLQYALTGPLEASSYYTTHSELRALLGSAFEAAGQRDSAIAHYRWTVNAWRAADRVFVARRDSLRARLAALERTAGR